MPAAPSISNDLTVEGGALVWRLCGIRPTSDQHGGKGRGHKMAVARGKKEDKYRWEALLLSARSRFAGADTWEFPRPAQIVLRVWGASLPDSCNVSGHSKYAIDALVALGFLPDDGPKYVPRTIAESLVERPAWATPKQVGIEIRIERAA